MELKFKITLNKILQYWKGVKQMNKFIMSYSCGKDSTLALYRMINKGNIPVALITTINKYKKKSCFHGVSVLNI